MWFQSEKVMFEIYREGGSGNRYRLVYFTELNDRQREVEFDRALAGEHFFDGFIRANKKDEAKQIIEEAVRRLNEGDPVDPSELREALKPFAAG